MDFPFSICIKQIELIPQVVMTFCENNLLNLLYLLTENDTLPIPLYSARYVPYSNFSGDIKVPDEMISPFLSCLPCVCSF